MNNQRNRTAGYSGTQSRNFGYRDFHPEPPVVERQTNPKDIIVFEGVKYDRTILRRMMGTYPRIKASENAAVASVVVDSNVPRYTIGNSAAEKALPTLVMVDAHFKPILAPDTYDGKPLAAVALVSKHNLKRAAV